MKVWKVLFFFLLLVEKTLSNQAVHKASGDTEFDWSSWWSYDGISGPAFWGVINRRWRLCSDGRRQSPVDLPLMSLVYDHNLKFLELSTVEVDGILTNTGFGLHWSPAPREPKEEEEDLFTHQPVEHFYISGGPFLYKYALAFSVLRWSTTSSGSEHTLQGQHFPAEVQLFFYNVNLYANFSEASTQPNGIAAVSVFVKTGWRANPVLKIWLDRLHMVPHRGKSTWIPFIPIRDLFSSDLYMTYEGSLTEPPCDETISWVILNKPVYVTADQLWQLQSLRRGSTGGSSLTANNVRPLQPFNGRVLRTNIPPVPLECLNRTAIHKYQAFQLDPT